MTSSKAQPASATKLRNLKNKAYFQLFCKKYNFLKCQLTSRDTTLDNLGTLTGNNWLAEIRTGKGMETSILCFLYNFRFCFC